jgi:HEAT repeat protein
VVIRRSSLAEVQHLLADLTHGEAPLKREAAVARLRVIGARAVRQVLETLAQPADPPARAALLRVLEGRREAGVVEATLAGLSDSSAEVRAAAMPVARSLLDDARGAELLDRLTTLALDPDEAAPVRLAAIGVLHELPARTVAPVLATLLRDPEASVRAAAAHPAGHADDPAAELEDASRSELPADPQRLLDALAAHGEQTPLPTLHRLVTVLREREPRERREARRREWLAARGAVHDLLARRDSRVALYDLREALEASSEALPVAFAKALAAIGDASCLDALGAAYARTARQPQAADWRAALADAAHAIVTREKLTARHHAVRRIRARWGSTVDALFR